MICENKSNFLPELKVESFSAGTACVVDFSKMMMDLARRSSCGKCVLCREGTWQVHEIIKDITEGKTQSGDFELARELLEQISINAGCEMSVTAASHCRSLLENYQEEWDQHIRRKRCTSLTCKVSYTLFIAPELCDGCEKCVDICPQAAIVGGMDMIHVMDAEKCNKCLLCVDVCPKGAIKKAGAVKPKLPVEPVPVGSFGAMAGEAEEGSGMRRRRRG
jgi:ferredoxin